MQMTILGDAVNSNLSFNCHAKTYEGMHIFTLELCETLSTIARRGEGQFSRLLLGVVAARLCKVELSSTNCDALQQLQNIIVRFMTLTRKERPRNGNADADTFTFASCSSTSDIPDSHLVYNIRRNVAPGCLSYQLEGDIPLRELLSSNIQ